MDTLTHTIIAWGCIGLAYLVGHYFGERKGATIGAAVVLEWIEDKVGSAQFNKWVEDKENGNE